MKRQYHVGTVKGPKNTLIIQARRDVDFLSCECWEYFGVRETTKKALKEKAKEFMAYVNAKEGTNFRRVVVD